MTTTASKCPFAGHPAYDEATRNHVMTPRTPARVKPEAEEYSKRNRGSLEMIMSTEFNDKYETSCPQPRYSSSQGMENMLRARGTVSNIIQGGYKSLAVPEVQGRTKAIKPEADAIAVQHKGGRMNLLLTNYGRNEVTPRPEPRVKSEAAANYQMSRGSVMCNLLHSPGELPVSAKPQLRVKPEAENNAMKNRGSMNSIMRTCTPRY